MPTNGLVSLVENGTRIEQGLGVTEQRLDLSKALVLERGGGVLVRNTHLPS